MTRQAEVIVRLTDNGALTSDGGWGWFAHSSRAPRLPDFVALKTGLWVWGFSFSLVWFTFFLCLLQLEITFLLSPLLFSLLIWIPVSCYMSCHFTEQKLCDLPCVFSYGRTYLLVPQDYSQSTVFAKNGRVFSLVVFPTPIFNEYKYIYVTCFICV